MDEDILDPKDIAQAVKARDIPPPVAGGFSVWCRSHWDGVVEDIADGDINGTWLTLLLVDGFRHHPKAPLVAYKGNFGSAIEGESPLCCWFEERDGFDTLKRTATHPLDELPDDLWWDPLTDE